MALGKTGAFIVRILIYAFNEGGDLIMNLVTLFDELCEQLKQSEYCCLFGGGYITVCKNNNVVAVIIRMREHKYCIVDKGLQVHEMFRQKDIIDYFC